MPGAEASNAVEQLALFENGPDVQKLRAGAALFVLSSQAPNTRKAYASDWRDFTRWCTDAGRDRLPASADTLKLYLVDQLNRHTVATVQRRIAAIVAMHREHKLEPPYSYALREMMRGARRAKGCAPKQKAALSPEDLRTICVELRRRKTKIAVRDRALLTLGFAAAMRRSEITALNVDDIRFAPKGIAVRLNRSKTDQEANGREVGVFYGKRASTCPVKALRSWLYLRGREAGPLFPGGYTSTTGRLSGRSIGIAVKRAVAMAGLDPAIYGAHSLRAGCITAAALDGVPTTLIMERSGHRSIQTLAGYVRIASVFAVDVLKKAM